MANSTPLSIQQINFLNDSKEARKRVQAGIRNREKNVSKQFEQNRKRTKRQ